MATDATDPRKWRGGLRRFFTIQSTKSAPVVRALSCPIILKSQTWLRSVFSWLDYIGQGALVALRKAEPGRCYAIRGTS